MFSILTKRFFSARPKTHYKCKAFLNYLDPNEKSFLDKQYVFDFCLPSVTDR